MYGAWGSLPVELSADQSVSSAGVSDRGRLEVRSDFLWPLLWGSRLRLGCCVRFTGALNGLTQYTVLESSAV